MAQTRDFYLNPIQNVGGVKLLKNETLECCPAAILFPINLLRSGFREIRFPHDSVLRAISLINCFAIQSRVSKLIFILIVILYLTVLRFLVAVQIVQ